MAFFVEIKCPRSISSFLQAMGVEGSKGERDGALSPPLSIISEAEVPYVSSFGTERPIGGI